MNRFVTTLSEVLINKRWYLFTSLVIVTVITSLFLKNLSIDNSLEGWFLDNDPTLADYDTFKKLYGNDEIISVLVNAPGSVFEKDFSGKIHTISERLEQHPLIRRVLSTTHAPYMDGANGELTVDDMMPAPPGAGFDSASFRQRVLSNPLWEKILLGKDPSAVMFLIEPAPRESAEIDSTRPEILAFVNDTFAGTDHTTAGMGVMYEELNRISMNDSALFPSIAYLILILVLFLFFRKGSVLVASTLTLVFSALLFMGLYAMCGQKLNMLSAVLPTLIIIICLADIVHIFLHYEKTEPGSDRLKRCLSVVLVPCFFTSVTTAVGFASLASSPMAILKSFGIFAGIGVIIAYIVAVIISILVLSRRENTEATRTEPSQKEQHPGFTDRVITVITQFNLKNHSSIATAGVLLIITGIFGLFRLNVDTYSIDFLLDSNPVKQESRSIEKDYGFYLPLELRLTPVSEHGVKDPVFLKKLAELQETFDAMPGFSGTTSLADIVKQLNMVLTDNSKTSHTIPDTRNAIAQELLLYELDEDNDLEYFTDESFSELRLTVKIPMVSGKTMAGLMEKARKAVSETYGNDVKLVFGGYVPLYVKLLDYVTSSQIKSFLIAFVCIFGMMALLFRTPAVIAIGIVPNIAPILLTLGFMGYAGINLDIATVTIAVIVIGIAVDDTIHFIFTYNRKRREGDSVESAIEYTLKTSGKAIIITSVMLITGYSVLLFAGIKSVIFFGLLISISMASALACDLFLLPSLLILFAGNPQESKIPKQAAAMLCLLFIPFTPLPASSSETLSGYDIAEKAYHVEDGEDLTSRISMTITKPDGKIKTRDLRLGRKDYGEDNRSILVFKTPADVRGTSFLTWNHKTKENDQWLYLPALKKNKRIAASGKAKSFMGSDFSYDDMSKRALFKDTFKRLKDATVEGMPCFVIEALAKEADEPFTRRVVWVRKDSFLIVKTDYYNSKGTLCKQFSAGNISHVDQISTIHHFRMDDLENGGHSEMILSDVRYNTGLPERLFNVQGLKHCNKAL